MLSQQVVTKKEQLAAKERKTEGLCTNVALTDFTSRRERPVPHPDENLVQTAGTEQGNRAVQMQC